MTEDYTKEVTRWLAQTHEITDPKVSIPMMAGLSWGLALAARHPEYAQHAHVTMTTDYKRRAAGDETHFQAMAVASGDERTSPEKMADELVEAVEIHT